MPGSGRSVLMVGKVLAFAFSAGGAAMLVKAIPPDAEFAAVRYLCAPNLRSERWG